MTRLQGWGLGLVAFSAALILLLPAALLDAGLKRASDGKLRLVESSGTLWAGSGQIELRDDSGVRGIAQSASWHCSHWSVLTLRLNCDMTLERSPRRFPITISLFGLRVRNADIAMPGAILGLAVPTLAPLGLGGEVAVHIDDATLRSQTFDGRVVVQWRAARSKLTPVAPLGDYEMILDGHNGAPRAVLRTLQGPLQIDGKDVVANDGSRMFRATLLVPLPQRAQLVPLLRLIAVERMPGSFELEVK